jgi:hypothetical protein
MDIATKPVQVEGAHIPPSGPSCALRGITVGALIIGAGVLYRRSALYCVCEVLKMALGRYGPRKKPSRLKAPFEGDSIVPETAPRILDSGGNCINY